MDNNFLVNTTVALAATHLMITNLPRGIQQALFLKYVSWRNFFFGDPNGCRKPYVESVEILPIGGTDLYDTYVGTLGVDVSDHPLVRMDLEMPIMADYETVWKILKDGLPEFHDEEMGRILVVYRDEWGQTNKRVYPTSSGIPLPLYHEKPHKSSSVVHVMVGATPSRRKIKTETKDEEPGEEEEIEVYQDFAATDLFRQWIRKRCDFSNQACLYALAHYIHDNEGMLDVLEQYENLRIHLSFTFSDLSVYEHSMTVEWPVVDLTRNDSDSD